MDAYKESILITFIIVLILAIILISTEHLLISLDDYTFVGTLSLKIMASIIILIMVVTIDIV